MSESIFKTSLRQGAAVVLMGGLSILGTGLGHAEAKPSSLAEPTDQVLGNRYLGIVMGGKQFGSYTTRRTPNREDVTFTPDTSELSADDINFSRTGTKRIMEIRLPVDVDPAVEVAHFPQKANLRLYDESSRYFSGQQTAFVHNQLHAPNTDVEVLVDPQMDL